MPYEIMDDIDEVVKPSKSEGILGSASRNLARLGSRAVEQVIGLPGSIESLGRGALNLIDKGMGREPSVSSETLLPTPQNVRDVVKSETEGRLEPQGPYENFGDEVVSDIIPLLLGGVGAARSLGTAGLGNLAKVATQYVGGSERSGDLVKAGTMLALPFMGIPKAKEVAQGLYTTAESLLPQGASTSASQLSPSLSKINKALLTGLAEAPGKKELSSIVGQLQDKIVKGKIGVADLVQSKKDLGAIINAYPEIKGVKGLLPQLQEGIKNTIKGYGSQNKEYVSALTKADEVYHAINTGIKASDFFKKSMSVDMIQKLNPTTIGMLGAAFGAGLQAYKFAGPKGAAAALALSGLYNAGNKLFKSPTLRDIYLDVLKSAVKENAASLIKNVTRFDKAVSREEPEDSESPSGRYVIED